MKMGEESNYIWGCNYIWGWGKCITELNLSHSILGNQKLSQKFKNKEIGGIIQHYAETIENSQDLKESQHINRYGEDQDAAFSYTLCKNFHLKILTHIILIFKILEQLPFHCCYSSSFIRFPISEFYQDQINNFLHICVYEHVIYVLCILYTSNIINRCHF